ncbi:MAG: flagellar basal body rod protein FlgB [Campylobacterales bacterium]|nr:flagellar basal body rod protein FlgB [Campylobacterales bacterium]
MVEFNKSNKYIATALNARSVRQDMISSNIANVDTPFYRSRDLNFEQLLAKKAHQEFAGAKDLKLNVAKTNGAHLDPIDDDEGKPTIFYRDGHMARNDGNTVDLDVEMSEQSKNGVMYNALVESLKKNKMIVLTAIESGKNL